MEDKPLLCGGVYAYEVGLDPDSKTQNNIKIIGTQAGKIVDQSACRMVIQESEAIRNTSLDWTES